MFSIFSIFSAILIFSSLMVIVSKNPVYSVLYLILCFFNAAIIFLISNAEFLAMTLLIVYVGAVAVLFLFVVMMLNINIVKIKEGFLKYLPFGIMLILIFLAELIFVFSEIDIVPLNTAKINMTTLYDSGFSNTKMLGLFLYTDYFIIFQISSIVLLVAMIGAIVLAFRKADNSLSQNIDYQENVKKRDLIKLHDIKSNSKIN
ncbi:MAG: NADH:ubiquinone oxidoreductase subunit J [Rickettsiales bacterium]|nr:NADH:ubiquinone oxidoreductase subunit J [Rickettsiales bacterium]